MHSAMPSRLQSLATDFADKASMLVDLNERALALRTGGLQAAEDEGQEGGGGGRRGGGGGRYGEGGQSGFPGNRRARGGLGGLARGMGHPGGRGDRGDREGGRGGRGGNRRPASSSGFRGGFGEHYSIDFQRTGGYRQNQRDNPQSMTALGRPSYRRQQLV
ncbi:hypothetical protein WJX84_002782 [Apatococcus fuscideae]|uniref:EIF3CL-like C-terminal domain-containing protein n=1 Tax=Apatococcus fuscideae TaxID=2026836 RepID=A0AAW1TH21_9CHLO